MLLLNAFSLNMLTLTSGEPTAIIASKLSEESVRQILSEGFESAVGHADTAAVFSSVLGMAVPANRATVRLAQGQHAVVGQYRGPRLSEGTTELPKGSTIEWVLVSITAG
jgi:hypothetical protein